MTPLIAEDRNLRYSKAQICTTETGPKEKRQASKPFMADKDQERIKYELEVLKFTALVAVGTAGGSVGACTIAWRLDRRIRRLIEDLKESI